MNSKYNKPLIVILAVCALIAVIGDGFFNGHGLATVIGSLVALLAIITCCGLEVLDNRRVAAAVKRELRTPDVNRLPVFAHVPVPGEPGYDPTYDPDDDKYWRRYY